jgi:hypothetical protein
MSAFDIDCVSGSRDIWLAARSSGPANFAQCDFFALVDSAPNWHFPFGYRFVIRGIIMKNLAVAFALVVVSLSLAGCFVGKGKAPAPIVTKG